MPVLKMWGWLKYVAAGLAAALAAIFLGRRQDAVAAATEQAREAKEEQGAYATEASAKQKLDADYTAQKLALETKLKEQAGALKKDPSAVDKALVDAGRDPGDSGSVH